MPTATSYPVLDYTENAFVTIGGPASSQVQFNYNGSMQPPWLAAELNAGHTISHRRIITATGPVGYQFSGDAATHSINKFVFTMVDIWTGGSNSTTFTATVAPGSLPFPLIESIWSDSSGEIPIISCNIMGNAQWWIGPINVCGETVKFQLPGGLFNFSGSSTYTNQINHVDVSSGSYQVFSYGAIGNFSLVFAQCSYTWHDPQTNPTARYYRVQFDCLWEGPFHARIRFSPTDCEGVPIIGSNMCQVTFGNIYKRPLASSRTTVAIQKGVANGDDKSKYFFIETLPLDKTYHYPAIYTWHHETVTQRTQYDTLAGFDNIVVDNYYNQVVRSGLTNIRIDLPRDKWYGLPATTTAWEEGNILDSAPQFLYHPDAQVTNVNLATLRLPASRHLTAPTGFTVLEGGAFGSITNLADGNRFTVSAGHSQATFQTPDDNAHLSWLFRPYRFLAFDYNVTDGDPIFVTVNLDMYWIAGTFTGNQWFRKQFTFELSGSGTQYIDTMDPDNITASGPAGTNKTLAESYNNDELTEEMISEMTTSSGVHQFMFGRLSGIYGINHLGLIISGPSTVEITNWRGAVRYAATYNQMPWVSIRSTRGIEQLAAANTFGEIDGRDWLRSRCSGASNAILSPGTYISNLATQWNLTVTNDHTGDALNSAWVAPTTWAGLSAPPGQFPRHGIMSPYSNTYATLPLQRVMKKDILNNNINIPFTMSGQKFQGFLGLQQVGIFSFPPNLGATNPIIIDVWFVFGQNYLATSIPNHGDTALSTGKKVRVKGTKADLATPFQDDYRTGARGFVQHKSTVVRPADWPGHTTWPQDVQHYSPDEKTPVITTYTLKTLRAAYWIGFIDVPVPGSEIAVWQTPWGHLFRASAIVENGNIEVRGVDATVPVPSYDTTMVVANGNCTGLSIATDHLARLHLLFGLNETSVLTCYEIISDDDNNTWGTATVAFNNAIKPRIAPSSDGGILRIAFRYNAGTSGPGTLVGTWQGPGDQDPSTEFTLKDDSGANIAVLDTGHDLAFASDSQGRFVLALTLNGETATTDWFSTDDGRTWTKIV